MKTLPRSPKETEPLAAREVAGNLAQSDFLTGMSRELRSPLQAILGFAQLMESTSPLPTAQAARVTQILDAGWSMMKLIDEVLDFAVMESGQLSLSMDSVSLSEVLVDSQAKIAPQAEQRGIRIVFPEFEHPIFVSADRTRLNQIVISLLSNAIRYKEGGTLTVECALTAPERIRISVRDRGAGLSPEKLAQLFQPFNRLDQEGGGVPGTGGIGLLMTRRLAELMGGVVGVESTPAMGSMLWCELNSDSVPQHEVQSGEAGASVQLRAPAAAPQHTLLCLEDNPANMELIEQLIARRPDIRLLTAVNGILGIELARANLPTVILMDINLPIISGIEALKILREDPATAHIPVVALSANALPRDIQKGLEAGFFRYITKPIRVTEFMDTLNAALEFAEQMAVQNV